MYMNIYYDEKVKIVIRSLSDKESVSILSVVDLFIDYGFNLPSTYLKKLTKIIWEFRAGRYRLLFGIIGATGIVTNIFIKKTQKTSKKEIELAIKRLKQYEK